MRAAAHSPFKQGKPAARSPAFKGEHVWEVRIRSWCGRDHPSPLILATVIGFSQLYCYMSQHIRLVMASSSSGAFDLFEAIYGAPDLLELVVQQCDSGSKNELRLACRKLKAAVEACITGLTWRDIALDDHSYFFADFRGAKAAKNMAVFARCPRLQTLHFNERQVLELSPIAVCTGLTRVTGICVGGNLAPFAALTHLEHLDCRYSAELSDISALAACTALKYLNFSGPSAVKRLPPLPACLETLICSNAPLLCDASALSACSALKHLECNDTPLTDISALSACTALTHLDCRSCGITTLPPLPASLEILRISRTQCTFLSPLAACIKLCSLDCNHTPVRDLAPLAACWGLRFLNCKYTLVRDLMPLLACKRLEMLECDDFDGVDDQTGQLLLGRPELDVMVRCAYPDVYDYKIRSGQIRTDPGSSF